MWIKRWQSLWLVQVQPRAGAVGVDGRAADRLPSQGRGAYERGMAREGLPVTHSCWAFAIFGPQTRLQGQDLWLRGLHYDLPYLGDSQCCRKEQDHIFGSRRGSKVILFGSYPRLQAKSALVPIVLQTLSIHLSLCRCGHQWEQLGWQWYLWIKCYTFIKTSRVSYHMITL